MKIVPRGRTASLALGLFLFGFVAGLFAADEAQAAKRPKHRHRSKKGKVAAVLASSSTASGSFGREGDGFSVVDAYAYLGPGFFGNETVVKVRLAGHRLDRTALEGALDLTGELDRQTAEDAGTVTLDVAQEDGAWEGLSFRLPKGAACGYCSSRSQAAQAHLMIEDGRVLGWIRTKAADALEGNGFDIDLTLAVPIAKPVGETLLAQDGGEVGRFLLDCRGILSSADRVAIARVCGDAIAARLDAFEGMVPEEQAEGLRNDLLGDLPSLSLPQIEISGGRTKGDQAEIYLAGSRQTATYRGSLFLRKIDGVWRIERDRLAQVWE